MTKISLTILSILFVFSVWIFIKSSPKDEKNRKYVSFFNVIIFLLIIVLCILYTLQVPEILKSIDNVGSWTGLFAIILGYLIIFSACLLSGVVIRLLLFRKSYTNFKSFILFLPVIISFILLAAHFLRASSISFTFCILGVLFLILYFLEPLSAKVAQIILVLGSIEWIRSGYVLASIRIQNNQPVMRLIFITGGVACFTLLSSLTFFTKTIKERYKIINKNE